MKHTDITKAIYNNEEVKALYWAGLLIWERPKKTGGVTGKFIDSSVASDWKYKLNGVETSLDVDPETKTFNLELTEPLTTCYQMFGNSLKLESLDVSGIDTSNVVDMAGMFYKDQYLTSLNVSSIDTSSVEDMRHMFNMCNKLTSLDVSNFDTSKVKKMTNMFSFCGELKNLDLSNFDTSNVDDMYRMFYGNTLETLDVSNFDTSKVTDMSEMFAWGSTSKPHPLFTFLDLSNFDTSNVINMKGMFTYCRELQSIKLGNWNVGKVTSFDIMFMDCRSLSSVSGSIYNIKYDLDLRNSPLTNASAMVFINGLADVTSTKTLTLKTSTFDTLTEEQIATATAKGWTLVAF